MFAKKYILIPLCIFCFCFLEIGCNEQEAIDEMDQEEIEEENPPASDNDNTIDSPWDHEKFNSFLVGNDFQVDNDGDGAHNWDASEYVGEPIDHGLDIRDFFWEENGNLELLCPPGNTRRRSEFREQMDRDLSSLNRMEFTCQFFNVPNEKLIFAQLHNDGGASRPYVTAFVEDGEIIIERTDSPINSGSSRFNQTLRFDVTHTYEVVLVSMEGSTDITLEIVDLDNLEMITNTWPMPNEWEQFDGQFYFKFGAYMPKGGSVTTRTQIQTLEMSGY